ncbi:hypothetical protein ANICBIBUN_P2_12515 (plasmid) [Acinetobacter nosocomialis 28F]|jgi:hypothetical protein|uniref:Uncharacterized protein n=1 Tax=Acinetobacter nosocomialis 28F TaxID=1147131 RepID=A0AA36KMF1_ACINO|nr:hypothetical protein ANICBIBUN_P2_12515 [Acinetobacter nosocomialis 28F]
MKKTNVHIFIWKFVIGLFFFSFLMTYVHSNAEITNLSMLFYGFKVGLWFATALLHKPICKGFFSDIIFK